MNQKPKHTETSPSSYDAAAYGCDYRYDGSGGSAQASHGVSPSHAVTKHRSSDQRSTGHDVRYKFTGKERDAETGFDYFGARYYSSDLSIWLGVDPIIKPNESPYLYCAGNPIMFIDPDGRDWIKNKEGDYEYQKGVTKETTLAEGESYIGKTAEIKVNDEDGNYQYSYNLNEDGSMTDGKGVKHKNGFGVFDPKFKSGSKIISNKQSFATVFAQYEARGSAGITGSIAYGVTIDFNGIMSLYRTWSLGVGPTIGYTINPTLGAYLGGGSGDIQGSGFNYGAWSNIYGVQRSGEVNLYYGGPYGISAIGGCGSVSLLGISYGWGLGAYVDYSNTTIIARGTPEKILMMYYSKISSLRGTLNSNEARRINSFQGIWFGAHNDFK